MPSAPVGAAASPAARGRDRRRRRAGCRRGFRPDIEGLRAIAILTVLALPRRASRCAAASSASTSSSSSPASSSPGCSSPSSTATGRSRGSGSWAAGSGACCRPRCSCSCSPSVVSCVRRARAAPARHRRRHRGGRRLRRQLGASPAGRPTTSPRTCCPSPVQHFWSLAVEEQFYVVWPLLLIVARARRAAPEPPGRRHGRSGPLVASSFVWSVWFSHTSPRPAFFTTTTRVWELGIGALLAVALAGRPRPTHPGPRLGRPGLGRARRAGRRRRSGSRRASTGRAPGRCCRPCRPRCSSGSAGRGRRAARSGCSAPRRWSGSVACRTRSTSGTGRSSSWAAGPPMPFGATLPAWGLVVLALASVVPAWLSWRFVESPIHHGPWLRDRPRALLAAGLALSLRRRARGPAAASRSARRSPPRPPAAPCPPLSQLGAATLQPGQPFAPVDDPGWVTPDPLVVRAGPARRPTSTTARSPSPATRAGRLHLRRPAGHAPPSPWSATPRRCSGFRRSRRPRRPGAGGSSPTASRRAPSPTPRRPRRVRPTPSATSGTRPSWTRCAPTRPTSSSPPAWRRAPGPAAAPHAAPLVEGYASRWTTLADAGVPVVVVGDSPVSPDDLDVCAARHPTELTRCSFDTASAVARQRSGGAARGGRRGIRDGRATCTCSTSRR